MSSDVPSASSLDKYLLGNGTLAQLQSDVALMEKVFFGLVLADAVLFFMLCLALCAVCGPCEGRRARRRGDYVPAADVTSEAINALHEPPPRGAQQPTCRT